MNYKKKNGIFFTEDIKVKEILINGLINSDSFNKKILEPACGNGELIITILEYLYKLDKNPNKFNCFLKNNLFFNDFDKNILQECEKNIFSWYEKHFHTKISFKLNSFSFDFTIKEKIFENNLPTMDYIISNPPYVSYYGRRDNKKSEEKRNYYLRKYMQFPNDLKNGKLNLSMFFIENSLALLKKDGILSVIVDSNFNELPYYYTRNFILENFNIYELVFNISNFKNVASGQMIIKVKNNKNFEKLYISNFKTKEKYTHTKKTYIQDFDKKILNLNKPSKILNNILFKIDSKTKKLKNIYGDKTIRTSTMLLNMEDQFTSYIKNNYSLKENEFFYYKGSKSLNEKFNLNYVNHIFNYNTALKNTINTKLSQKLKEEGIKNKKRIMLGKKDIFLDEKIYIRQSAKEIICSYDAKPSASNNSLYILTLKKIDKTKELMFLTGYLNSDLITFYSQKKNIIKFTAGKQPQIRTSELNSLPIIENKILKEKISFLVDNFYRKKNINNKKELLLSINELIYDFFEFSDKEIQYIKDEISLF